MNKDNKTKMIYARLTPSDYERLEALADANLRTVSAEMTLAVRKHLAEYASEVAAAANGKRAN